MLANSECERLVKVLINLDATSVEIDSEERFNTRCSSSILRESEIKEACKCQVRNGNKPFAVLGRLYKALRKALLRSKPMESR